MPQSTSKFQPTPTILICLFLVALNIFLALSGWLPRSALDSQIFIALVSAVVIVALVRGMLKSFEYWNEQCPHAVMVNRTETEPCAICLAEAQEELNDAVRRLRKIENLRAMDPYKFEHFVLEIYRRLGWEVESTPCSHDGGIDGFLRKGRTKLVLQCKCNAAKNLVGAPILYALLGVVGKTNANGGVLVTTSGFSKNAEEWAEGQNIELIGECQLLSLIEQALGPETGLLERVLSSDREIEILRLADASSVASDVTDESELVKEAIVRLLKAGKGSFPRGC